MQYQDLLYEKQGHYLTITLNREEARNAYSEDMIDSIIQAFDQAELDDDIRCVILTGAGKTFSAGGDLKIMRAHEGMFEGKSVNLRSRYLQGIHRVPRRLFRFNKPLIAALNGAAIGAGLDLSCMCDMRIAAEHAKLGSTFVRLGLIPGDGGAYILSRVVGYSKALELILTGKVLNAQEALAIGLVNRVVPAESVMEEAMKYAEQIAQHAPMAVRMSKSACMQSWDMSFDQAMEVAATYQSIVQNTEDHNEGVDALLEKRSPFFKNK